MDKLKYIRVKGTSEYGTSIPIAVDWNNVDNKPITVDSNGIIDIANIPKAALERLTIVADDTARFALTTATVQTGDTVKVTSTGRMYYIIDDTKLNQEAGYTEYSAGTAASVPWSGINNKPTTISGYGITDVYTKTQVDTSLAAKSDKSTTYTKTEVDGFFDEKGLVDIEEGTDSEPYFFKASSFGDRLYEKIVGGSIVWNQLVGNNISVMSNGSDLTFILLLQYTKATLCSLKIII